MGLDDDKKYQETLKILRGEIEFEPLFVELKGWLRVRFGITACNFIVEKTKDENIIELCIFLSSTTDYNSMMKLKSYEYNKKKQKEISKAFGNLLKKYNGDKYYGKSIQVIYRDFSTEIKCYINNQIGKSIKSYIETKYSEYLYWNLYPIHTGVAVFFYKDKDVTENTINGICSMIKKDYFKAVKEIDEFNVYNWDDFVMTFDSKENLDKKYNGNIYAYGYK